jgi:hypothetical protein
MAETINKKINPKSIILLLVFIWLGITFFAILTQISRGLTSHHFVTMQDFGINVFHHIEYFTLRIWIPWVFLTPITLWLAMRLPIKPKKWIRALFLHAFILVCLTLIAYLFVSLHYHYFEDMAPGMETYKPWQHTGHFLFGDNVFLFNTIIYTILVTNINIEHFAQIAQKEAVNAHKLNHQLVESKLQTLKMQINPHFLFNTLNVISVLVMKSETDKATEMINKLSGFFRSTLDDNAQQWLPLKKELENVEQYLAIEQVRFGDRIQVFRNYDSKALSALLPAMILQPLIENAMQHGIEEKEGKGRLTINCQLQNNQLIIDIIDDGVGCNFDDKYFREGIGLSNVKSRLQQLYNNRHQFTLISNKQGGVTATLKLPMIKESDL